MNKTDSETLPSMCAETAKDLAKQVNSTFDFRGWKTNTIECITVKIWEHHQALEVDSLIRPTNTFNYRDLYLYKIQDLEKLEVILSEYF